MARAKDKDPLANLVIGLPPIDKKVAPIEVPARFLDFVTWLGVELQPGQRVACKVAFDGAQLSDLNETEVGIALEMFGDVGAINEQMRRIFIAVCGARGGKTYVFAALRILHLALTVSLDTMAPGEVASAPIIAPDKDLATQALNYVTGALDSKLELACMVTARGIEFVDIKRADGRTVEIVVKAASAKGKTGRGKSLVGAVLEEAAFFRDAQYKVNDDEIFKAISPRILPGGQLIIDSTPWTQLGLIYDLFIANHPNPKTAGIQQPSGSTGTGLAMHASTLQLRDVPLTRSIVAAERVLDPENALREFDAQFMSAGTETFFDPPTILKCLDETLILPIPPKFGDEIVSGADLGFSKNSSALVISHLALGEATLASIQEVKPSQGVQLKPSEVIGGFARDIVEHNGSYLMADGHYKATALEHLWPFNIGFLDAPMTPAEAFIAVRAKMREGKVHFPKHERLLRQMRETMCRRGSGGVVTIILPKWKTGEHGDLVSAMVLSLYQAFGEKVKEDAPQEGTAAHAAIQEEARKDARRKELEKDEGWARWTRGAGMHDWGDWSTRHPGRRR